MWPAAPCKAFITRPKKLAESLVNGKVLLIEVVNTGFVKDWKMPASCSAGIGNRCFTDDEGQAD